MDVFIEKLVKRKKTARDIIFQVGVVFLFLAVILLLLPYVGSLILFIIAGLGYLGYYLITGRNVEYEYSVTNGDLDVDMIIAQRKRKRVISVSAKEFEIIARMSDEDHNKELQNTNFSARIEAVSSMGSPDVYFAIINKSGGKTVLFFEPSERMLESFRTYIPRKVFI